MSKNKKLRLIFYDFEVFKHDFLVVFYDYKTMKKYEVVNDPDKLKRFFDKFKDALYIGYNNNFYDQYIFKSILLKMNPKTVNDKLIQDSILGYKISKEFKKIRMLNYDCMVLNKSLKQLEGMLGQSIEETEVDFDIDRKLTEKEIEQTLKYCNHDVLMTIEVFNKTYTEFDSHLGMINEFHLPIEDISKTQARLASKILGASKVHGLDDEFDYEIPDCIQLGQYEWIKEWYLNDENKRYKKINEKGKEVKNKITPIVYKLKHDLGFGGIHAALSKYFGEGFYVMSDIASMYPASMILFDLLSRGVEDKQKYIQIRDDRLILKHKKDKRQKPRKIVLNAVYGCLKDKNSDLYDPRNSNAVCIVGQLAIIDLLDKIEIEFGDKCQIIQSNTDGILVKLESKELYDRYVEVCKEWEKRIGYELEHDIYIKVIQKDVNNYIIVPEGELYDSKGEPRWKCKGAYVKKLSEIDYNCAILNEALVNYFIHGTPVEETINGCNELIKFQRVDKIGSSYECIMYGDKKLKEKVIRTFACTKDLPSVGKLKKDKKIKNKETGEYELKDSIEKIANTAPRCFIDNGNIIGKECPEYLDKQYYIDVANKRIDDFLGKGVRL